MTKTTLLKEPTNNFKTIYERLQMFEEESNTSIRVFITRQLKAEYEQYVEERKRLEDPNKRLRKISGHEMFNVRQLIECAILPSLPFTQILKIGEGSVLRNYVTSFIIDAFVKRLCKQNSKIAEIIEAEPAFVEDEYWAEYNDIFDTIDKVLGYTPGQADEEFYLANILCTSKDEMFAKMCDILNEEYPAKKEYEFPIKIKAMSQDEAYFMLAKIEEYAETL